MILYFYIYADDLKKYESEGWILAGKMRPDDWASLNRGNLIVCKPAPDISRESDYLCL